MTKAGPKSKETEESVAAASDAAPEIESEILAGVEIATDALEASTIEIESVPDDAASITIEGEISPDVAASPVDALSRIAWAADGLEILDDGTDAEATEVASDEVGAAETSLDAAPEDADETAEDVANVEFVDADRMVSLVESLLFVSDRPVSIGTFKQLFKGTNVRTKDILRALDTLASDYAASSRGVSLEEIQGGYQLRTKIDNADFIRRLAKTRPFRLSGPALETLSIVAYQQPIVKSEVDQVRGVESGHLLRALMERGLVSFAGKSELPGKPMQYGTTRKFLELFGLRNLKELPTLAEIDELIPEGIGDVEDKPVLADVTDAMAKEIGSTYSEGEDELMKISDQLQQINVSSEFFEQEKQRQRDLRDRERAQGIRDALAFGDPVEDKDKRWLERYEAKILEAQAASAAGEAGLTVPQSLESEIESEGETGEALEASVDGDTDPFAPEGLA